jgi:hydroxymethylpyrimidine pyrophosphatase-like HAD family hydrolase
LASQKIVDAIVQAQKVVHVGVATTRSLTYAQTIVNQLQLVGPSIFKAGVYLVDLPSGKILAEHVLSYEDVMFAAHLLQKYNVPFIIQDNEKDSPYIPTAVPEHPASLVVWNIDKHTADILTKELSHNNNIAVHNGPSWENKDHLWLSITNAQATKQHAVLEVAKLLHIDTKEIIGVGDAANDFPLLMACGLKVAMGNATEDLKAIANYIAPSVEEDGVADVIDRFILNSQL